MRASAAVCIGPFSGMGCIGDLDGVVSATAGAGVGAGATGVAGFQLDLLAKCSTLRSSVKSGSKTIVSLVNPE